MTQNVLKPEDVPEKDGSYVLWLDGCYDMFHYGHSNALRQAKKLFPQTILVAGIHSDDEIRKHKGPPVMNYEERIAALESCRWVDRVVLDAPFAAELPVLNREGVDYCIHGEDITLDCNGKHCYQDLIDAGKFMTVRRTRGVSTTNIVTRLLNTIKKDSEFVRKRRYSLTQRSPILPDEERTFFPSALRISQFSCDLKPPKTGDRIVYVEGTFDLFHVGHIQFLKKARTYGDYLIVGLHDDRTIKHYKGASFPILNLHERALGVLACKYVDDVIIGAPFVVTKNIMDVYNIDLVIIGSTSDEIPLVAKNKEIDPFEYPKSVGKFRMIESPRSNTTLTKIVERLMRNTNDYLKRQKGRKSEDVIFEEIEERKSKESED